MKIQYEDLKKSLYGFGDYKSVFFETTHPKWRTLSEEKQNSLYKKLIAGKISKAISKSGNLECEAKRLKLARKPGSKKRARGTKTRGQ